MGQCLYEPEMEKHIKKIKICQITIITLFRMDCEKLHFAIMGNENWGNKLSENDSFYRLLFKLDKVREREDKLKTEDAYWLFASYRKWFLKAEKLLEDCTENNAGNREALEYGRQLKFDILEHVHEIITESALEKEDLIQELIVKADIEKQRISRIQQEEAEKMNI